MSRETPAGPEETRGGDKDTEGVTRIGREEGKKAGGEEEKRWGGERREAEDVEASVEEAMDAPVFVLRVFSGPPRRPRLDP